MNGLALAGARTVILRTLAALITVLVLLTRLFLLLARLLAGPLLLLVLLAALVGISVLVISHGDAFPSFGLKSQPALRTARRERRSKETRQVCLQVPLR
jgi:hypothetical protein